MNTRIMRGSATKHALLVVSLIMCTTYANANENVVHTAADTATVVTSAELEAGPPTDRSLTEDQLSEGIQNALGMGAGLEAVGAAGHPFTTKRASAQGSSSPTDEYPWSATGKLFMTFGSSRFVCTASVIRKGLLVTAAHCVHNFGQKENGFADALTFEPARHEFARPFGTWTATEWWIPKAYFDGTDKCRPEAPGVVCENDVAVVVVAPIQDTFIGDITGAYDFNDGVDGNGYGYVNFLGEQSTQITQMGYPSRDFDGDKMIRTDSLGYQDTPNNVVIGSNQTGGSSGGPWMQNFGVDSSFGGTPATDDLANQVVAATSWGFTSDTVKLQGASRFSKNSIYTTKSNIRSLVDEACAANPDHC